MKILPISAVCLCCFFLFSTACLALPVHYTVTGTAIDNDGSSTLPISGWVNIDDRIRYWGIGGKPVPDLNYIDAGQYGYAITGFSLKVGAFDFSGTSGYLYLELWGGDPTLCLGDLQWDLTGSGAWTRWNHQLFCFLNADGSAQDSYLNLPSLILLPHTGDSYPELFSPEMLLSRQVPGPVPEPSTLVIVGASLLGLLSFRRFRS